MSFRFLQEKNKVGTRISAPSYRYKFRQTVKKEHLKGLLAFRNLGTDISCSLVPSHTIEKANNRIKLHLPEMILRCKPQYIFSPCVRNQQAICSAVKAV